MRVSLMLGLLLSVLLVGCGGGPRPDIDAVKPRSDATLVRVAIVPTNYDGAWDAENVRLRCRQMWFDRSGVPTANEVVFDQPFDAPQGTARGTIKMKDADGRSTRRVRLAFDVVSGSNPQSENVSAGTSLEWRMPGNLSQKDLILTAVLSRRGHNNYAIDVLYALDPQTGVLEQVLPNKRED
jgi:hypothetical protein